METKKYEIGGKTYVQKPLVLGQIRQIIDVLKDVILPTNFEDVALVIASLGSKISEAIAIILCEENTHLKDKNLSEFTTEVEWEISAQKTMEIVKDFFLVNDLESLWNEFQIMIKDLPLQVEVQDKKEEKTENG